MTATGRYEIAMTQAPRKRDPRTQDEVLIGVKDQRTRRERTRVWWWKVQNPDGEPNGKGWNLEREAAYASATDCLKLAREQRRAEQ